MRKQEDVEEKLNAELEGVDEVDGDVPSVVDAAAEDDEDEAAAGETEEEEEGAREEEDPLIVANREAEAHKDRWMRLAAEFDNYKKRTSREMQSLIESANVALIRDLLPTVDSVSRALDHADEDDGSESFQTGVRMIMTDFSKVLEGRGVSEIDALGQPFDPNDHEALMQAPSEEYEAGIVANVIEKGYRLGSKVLRHAKVVVSTGAPSGDREDKKNEA